jgi:hypothetical protein
MKHTQGKIQTGYYGGIKDGVVAVVRDEQTKRKLFSIFLDTFTGLDEAHANAERLELVWNAADGMTTEQAVRYIEHGAEMERLLTFAFHAMRSAGIERIVVKEMEKLIAKMEGK